MVCRFRPPFAGRDESRVAHQGLARRARRAAWQHSCALTGEEEGRAARGGGHEAGLPRALLALGRATEAKAAFTVAIAAQPAFLAERRELEEELRRLQ